jgi:hypothetical protein
MKHLTVESKDLLIGDEVADVLTEYAALIADRGMGDNVELHAVSSDGDEVMATIVLSSGTTLLIETSHNTLPEPENSEAVAYMRDRIKKVTTPPPVKPAEMDSWESEFDEL